jgi:hypothetical protein
MLRPASDASLERFSKIRFSRPAQDGEVEQQLEEGAPVLTISGSASS